MDEKVCVFEIKQHPEIEYNANQEQERLYSFILLPEDCVREDKINDCGDNDQSYKISAGLVEKVKRKNRKDIAPYFEIISETMVKANKNRKEYYKEAIVK